MHKAQDKPAQAAASLKFFDWAYVNGDKMAADLDYVPLPDTVKELVRKQWARDQGRSRQGRRLQVDRSRCERAGGPSSMAATRSDGAIVAATLPASPYADRDAALRPAGAADAAAAPGAALGRRAVLVRWPTAPRC